MEKYLRESFLILTYLIYIFYSLSVGMNSINNYINKIILTTENDKKML